MTDTVQPSDTALVVVPAMVDLDDTFPGAIITSGTVVVLNAGTISQEIEITNAGAVPVQIAAHFPLDRSNPVLSMDRGSCAGMRLDIPVGTSLRIAPGQTVWARMVPIIAPLPH